MKTSDEKPGSKKNPIRIQDKSQARANVSYIIDAPVKREKPRGETVSTE